MPDMGDPAGFTVELRTDLTPDEALRRVLDLRRHDRIIPFTRVNPPLGADALAPGTRFTARTSLGPLGFDDPMQITTLSFAPAGATIEKLGRIIGGSIAVDVVASADGSLVRWRQTVQMPWLPKALLPVATRVLRGGYRRVLVRLLSSDPGLTTPAGAPPPAR